MDEKVNDRLPLHLSLESVKSETDGTDEFYYTLPLGDGLEGELRNICLKHPNVTSSDYGEIGIYRMKQHTPLWFAMDINDRGGLSLQGRIPIYGGEKIYARVKGSTVDADVELHAIGYSFPALPQRPGVPQSP